MAPVNRGDKPAWRRGASLWLDNRISFNDQRLRDLLHLSPAPLHLSYRPDHSNHGSLQLPRYHSRVDPDSSGQYGRLARPRHDAGAMGELEGDARRIRCLPCGVGHYHGALPCPCHGQCRC